MRCQVCRAALCDTYIYTFFILQRIHLCTETLLTQLAAKMRGLVKIAFCVIVLGLLQTGKLTFITHQHG